MQPQAAEGEAGGREAREEASAQEGLFQDLAGLEARAWYAHFFSDVPREQVPCEYLWGWLDGRKDGRVNE